MSEEEKTKLLAALTVLGGRYYRHEVPGLATKLGIPAGTPPTILEDYMAREAVRFIVDLLTKAMG